MYVIGLNGPPRCGKDTFADMLVPELERLRCGQPIFTVSLAKPMRFAMMSMLGLDPRNDELYDIGKRTGISELGNTNLRQLMINFSEEFMKPKFGEDVWSRILAANYTSSAPGLIIIRDMGFQFEADFWRDWAGPDRFCVVRITREGTNFKRDSREWVTHTHLETVDNNGTMFGLRESAIAKAQMFARRWNLI